MRILVTGATGFIGGRLLNRLVKMGHDVIGVGRKGLRKKIFDVTNYSGMLSYCDLEDYQSVFEMMNRVRPQVVFHLAGNAVVKEDVSYPCDITKSNILATHHLLACCPLNTKFVFASSATVYGDYQGKPFSERDIPNPTSVYAITKWSSEQLVELYGKQGRVRPIIARLIANCGKGATHGVFCDIVKKLRSPSQYLSLLGERPGSCKPFLHVDDTVSTLTYLGFTESVKAGIYNVSAYDSITVEDMAEIIMNVTGMRKEVLWQGKESIWKGDNQMVQLTTRLEGILNVSSWISVEKAAMEEVI